MTEKTEVINVIEDIDEVAQPENEKESPVEDEPMESTADPFEDVEMQEDEHEPMSSGRELTTYHRVHESTANGDMVFRPERERSRRPREPSLLLGNGLIMADENTMDSDDDPDNDDHFYPPSPKRPRIDKVNLLAEAVLAYAASIGDANDAPTTYQQAMDSDEAKKWVKAMSAELKAHSENGSWSLVPKIKNVRTIGCRWVFAKKRNEHGQVVRYKARLVAKGFKQKFGVDFFETYSPVANMNSIRLVLAVVVAKGYVTEQMDADTAFLNSDLKEEVYMEVPNGIKNAEKIMCKLDKAIYGLKQAASAWSKTIHAVFLKIGFKISGADQCVYVKVNNGSFVYGVFTSTT
ncbi:unnamed protein product [Peronospora farinosa]|uniref:Reverse transcriptase Ty1/copia-type domain-containing protein n=1 Tax=Peronospora farinosa TaxID=134698 RepID=A0AAV0TRD1_9STRA|nr:unnamed protein product [Peronospora farinosa]